MKPFNLYIIEQEAEDPEFDALLDELVGEITAELGEGFQEVEDLVEGAGKGDRSGLVGTSMQGSEHKGSKTRFVYGNNDKPPAGKSIGGQPPRDAKPHEKWAHHVEAGHELKRIKRAMGSRMSDSEREQHGKEMTLNKKFRAQATMHPGFDKKAAFSLAKQKLSRWYSAAKGNDRAVPKGETVTAVHRNTQTGHVVKVEKIQKRELYRNPDAPGKALHIPAATAAKQAAAKAARTPTHVPEPERKGPLGAKVIARSLGPKGMPSHSTLAGSSMPPERGPAKPAAEPKAAAPVKSANKARVIDSLRNKQVSAVVAPTHGERKYAETKKKLGSLGRVTKKSVLKSKAPAPTESPKPVEVAAKAHAGRISSLNQHPAMKPSASTFKAGMERARVKKAASEADKAKKAEVAKATAHKYDKKSLSAIASRSKTS